MAAEIISKRCCTCKRSKHISEFYKNRREKDGFQSQCKTCIKQSHQKYRKSKKGKCAQKHYCQSVKGKANFKRYQQSAKGKATQKRYNQSEKGKANNKASQQRYGIRHPQRCKAQVAVNHAVNDGILPHVNTLVCHYCPKPAQQYHHWHGYSREHWLDVVPACIPCHIKKDESK